MRLTDKEKKELKGLASSQLKEDFKKMAKKRHNPFIIDGKIDLDVLVTFLNEYNNFIGHNLRPFRKIVNKIDKL